MIHGHRDWNCDEPFPLWDPDVPFPDPEQMEDLDIVTHVTVEEAVPGGYHYLHESSIAFHRGALWLCWANHRTAEVNVRDELIRGTVSTDGGFTWRDAETWVEASEGHGESFNHPVLHEDNGTLLGYFTRWDEGRPGVEIFTLDDDSGRWESTGARIPGFLPFRPPLKMRDGNWIMGGELFWYEAAVAISEGDNLTSWETVQLPRPEELKLVFPETALMDLGDRMIAICRPHEASRAPVSMSCDCGRTWATLKYSNYPLCASQPYCGRLSTAQHYLITCDAKDGRALISIAVTDPGGDRFRRVWKIRHQQYPRRRLFGGWGDGSMVGQTTEWSYPAAIEHDGNLYVSMTRGKEDCVLSIIPVRVLGVG